MPELAPAVVYLWQWYLEELQTGERLTWEEIQSWSIVCNKEVTETEALALRNLSLIHQRIRNTPLK